MHDWRFFAYIGAVVTVAVKRKREKKTKENALKKDKGEKVQQSSGY